MSFGVIAYTNVSNTSIEGIITYESEINLYSGGNNEVEAFLDGLRAYSGAESGFYSQTKSTSTVTLYAGESNHVSGNNYGIWSEAWGAGSSTVTLEASSNTIIAGESTGTAIYSYGSSTVEVTGATALTAATGAEASHGGSVKFNSRVTANTATVAQVILQWNLQRGVVVIPGSSDPAHIRENLDLFGFELTDQEMDRIAGLNRDGKHDWY